MRYAVIEMATGIINTVIETDSYYDGAIVFNQLYVDVTGSSITDEEYFTMYYKDGEFKELPNKSRIPPSKYHTWDLSSENWIAAPDYLDKVKLDTIQLINRKAGSKIIEVYPVYKQLNIGRIPNSSEAIAMFTFIDNIRDISNTLITNVNSATTLEEIKTITKDF